MEETFSKIVLILALISIVITRGEKTPTVAECNKIWDSDEEYMRDECSCMQDLDICKSTLVEDKICELVTLNNYYENLSDSCEVILKDCSSSDKNNCSKDMCECFTTFINCMNQNKCTPVPAKSVRRIRNFGTLHGFSDFVRGNVADDLKNE
uniref:Uncharacterized protein n=2 Tax=Meloidogyne TaxID=189290 RepID=A0A6V7US55_MELEN|nr:unnamed protein product [Meloidogyne enterolobii]